MTHDPAEEPRRTPAPIHRDIPGLRRSGNGLLLALLMGTGCATHQGTSSAPDPVEGMNRTFYSFNDTLDRKLFKPLASGYRQVTPAPARRAVGNFFGNLSYGGVIVNDFLQGKPEQGARDFMRLLVNSTFGIGGLLDLAEHFGLPRHEEDLGQTLAVWGLPAGPYLYLPLLGPTTTRNLGNIPMAYYLDPLNLLDGVYLYPLTALNVTDTRAALLEATKARDQLALDPYTFTREAYLQRREYLVYDGDPPLPDEFESLFEEDEDSESAPAPQGDSE